MADAVTWVSDGHLYDAGLNACTRCGIAWDSYLRGPIPCGALRAEDTDFGPEPEPWRWGYCCSCDIELCPPIDGDGVDQCKRCNRMGAVRFPW